MNFFSRLYFVEIQDFCASGPLGVRRVLRVQGRLVFPGQKS